MIQINECNLWESVPTTCDIDGNTFKLWTAKRSKVQTYINTADDILCNGMLFVVCYTFKNNISI